MTCYGRNQARLARIVDRIRRRVWSLPPPLRRLAREWWTGLGRDPRHYFSSADSPPLLHLPLWLVEGGAHGRTLPDGALDRVLEATALLYFHTRIQDDVLDEPHARGKPSHLLLGNVLELEGWRLFHRLPLSAGFWMQARAAWRLFSSETAAEHAQMLSSLPYPRVRFRRHARKVALARVPLHAVQDLSGRRTPALVNGFIDRLGEAYGLANDVLGVERDLVAGLDTHLIATVAQRLAAGVRPTTGRLRRALLEHTDLEDFLDDAMTLHRRLIPVGEKLGLACMNEFTAQRIERLRHHQARALGLRLSYALTRKP